jgi:hypothetical protein
MAKLEVNGDIARLEGRLDVQSVRAVHDAFGRAGDKPRQLDARALEGCGGSRRSPAAR